MRSRLHPALLASVLVLVVAGCASPSPESPPPASSPSAGPEPESPELPRSALPLNCQELVTTEVVQSQLVDPVQVRVDEASAPMDLWDAALTQVGGLHCVWGGEHRTDASYDTGLTIDVLPDAAAEFATWSTSPHSGEQLRSAFGDDSVFWCDGTFTICRGDVLIGTYWLSLYLSDSRRPVTSDAATRQTLTTLLQPMIDAIRTAPPARPLWVPPTESVEPCSGNGRSEIEAALGLPSDGFESWQVELGDYPDLTNVALVRAKVAGCRWVLATPTLSSYPNSVDLTVLPGGAWVFPSYATQPPSWTLAGAGAPRTHPSVGTVYSACGDGCHALLARNSALVNIGSTEMDAALFAPVVDGIAAALP